MITKSSGLGINQSTYCALCEWISPTGLFVPFCWTCRVNHMESTNKCKNNDLHPRRIATHLQAALQPSSTSAVRDLSCVSQNRVLLYMANINYFIGKHNVSSTVFTVSLKVWKGYRDKSLKTHAQPFNKKNKCEL